MKKTIQGIWLFLVLMILYLPILILAVYSFSESTMIGSLRAFSLQNYVTLFTTPELIDMIVGTFTLAFTAAVISTLLGTMGAIGAFYSKKRV
ncbi:MAG: ABC transporter permease, partial [Lachnospiraceae bacterium]|nr:ABC transporter permease [Lachnospiraceae bacterium]